MNSSPNVTHWLWPYASFSPPPLPPLCTHWCREHTSHDCWPPQHTDSHNPSHELGPSSSSPGQARPSLHKTLIDLMDLCAIHTPSPNKQSAQDFSPLRQRVQQHRRAVACEGDVGLPELLISPLGLGEGLSVLFQFITQQMKPPSLLHRGPRSTRVDLGSPSYFQACSQSAARSAKSVPTQRRIRRRGTQQLLFIRGETSAKCLATHRFLKDVTPKTPRRHYFNLTAVNCYVGRFLWNPTGSASHLTTSILHIYLTFITLHSHLFYSLSRCFRVSQDKIQPFYEFSKPFLHTFCLSCHYLLLNLLFSFMYPPFT